MPAEATNDLLVLFCKELGFRIAKHTILDEVEKHPDSNSLLAISEILNHLGIPNAGFNLTLDEFLNFDIPFPFIAHTKENEFLIINSIDTIQVRATRSSGQRIVLELSEFTETFSGNFLLVDKQTIGYKNGGDFFGETLEKFRFPLLFSLGALVLTVILCNCRPILFTLKWYQIAIVSIKLMGLLITVLLLIYKFDQDNKVIKSLCQSDDGDACATIINANGANITSFLSWSEVGFFYFIGTLLIFLFFFERTGVGQALIILNISCLPFTFFSVYYQWRLAKRWCKLCMAVQIALWGEFLMSFGHFGNYKGIEPSTVLLLLSLLMLPVVVWYIFKPLIENYVESSNLREHLAEFKYNESVFETLQASQVQRHLLPDQDVIVLGDINAQTTITVVASPVCDPCAETHQWINKIISANDDIKVQLVFFTPPDPNMLSTEVASHVLKLKAAYGDVKANEALEMWYTGHSKEVKHWKNTYVLPVSDVKSNLTHTHRMWCSTNEVVVTPTIYVNGRLLSNLYNWDEINYLI